MRETRGEFFDTLNGPRCNFFYEIMWLEGKYHLLVGRGKKKLWWLDANPLQENTHYAKTNNSNILK